MSDLLQVEYQRREASAPQLYLLRARHILLSRHKMSSIAFSHQFFNDDQGRELLHESSTGSSTNASKAHYSQSRSNHCTTIPYPTRNQHHCISPMHGGFPCISNIVPITFTACSRRKNADFTNFHGELHCFNVNPNYRTPSRRAKR